MTISSMALAGALALALLSVAAPAQTPPEEPPVPALREPFASLVPPALVRALRCQRFDISPDSLGVPQKPGTHCVAWALPAVVGDPQMAIVQVDAEGNLMLIALSWGIEASAGGDTVRTTALDSAYASTRALLTRHFGTSRTCGRDIVWVFADGAAALAPPQRQRRRSSVWGGPPIRFPEYGRWTAVLQPGVHSAPWVCAAAKP